MKMMLWALFVAIAVALAGGSVAWAADAPDPVVGTWTLNLAKSKFSSGPPAKSETRTYAHPARDMTLTVKGIAADGSSVSWSCTYRYDGKDYPIIGSSEFDTLSVKRINASTIRYTTKMAGKVVLTGTRTISADGKVLTHSSKGADAKGIPFNDVTVYDKQ